MSKITIRDLLEYQSGGFPMEQVLVVENGENGAKEPAVCAFFPDVEMDVFCVEFRVDGEITFHAQNLEYIMTDRDQLASILILSDEAKALNDELTALYTDDGEYGDYSHLLTKPNRK